MKYGPRHYNEEYNQIQNPVHRSNNDNQYNNIFDKTPDIGLLNFDLYSDYQQNVFIFVQKCYVFKTEINKCK